MISKPIVDRQEAIEISYNQLLLNIEKDNIDEAVKWSKILGALVDMKRLYDRAR